MIPTWMNEGSCSSVGGDWWFPEPGVSARTAKTVCAGCDVLAQCRDYALADPELHGVWGGTTDHERSLLRRRNPRIVTVAPTTEHGTEAGYKRHRRAHEKPCRACRDGMLAANIKRHHDREGAAQRAANDGQEGAA